MNFVCQVLWHKAMVLDYRWVNRLAKEWANLVCLKPNSLRFVPNLSSSLWGNEMIPASTFEIPPFNIWSDSYNFSFMGWSQWTTALFNGSGCQGFLLLSKWFKHKFHHCYRIVTWETNSVPKWTLLFHKTQRTKENELTLVKGWTFPNIRRTQVITTIWTFRYLCAQFKRRKTVFVKKWFVLNLIGRIVRE